MTERVKTFTRALYFSTEQELNIAAVSSQQGCFVAKIQKINQQRCTYCCYTVIRDR